jgi:hypothetical protein
MINDYFSSPLSLNFGSEHMSHTDFAFALSWLDVEDYSNEVGLEGFYEYFYGYDEKHNIFR